MCKSDETDYDAFNILSGKWFIQKIKKNLGNILNWIKNSIKFKKNRKDLICLKGNKSLIPQRAIKKLYLSYKKIVKLKPLIPIK